MQNKYDTPCPRCEDFGRRLTNAEKELAEARAYAHNLAISIYGQHYLDESPNWRPLPDLFGLLTQIDNMYAGLRNDLAAAEAENKRLVGGYLIGRISKEGNK